VYDEKQLKVVKLNVFVTLSDGGQSLIFEEHGVSFQMMLSWPKPIPIQGTSQYA